MMINIENKEEKKAGVWTKGEMCMFSIFLIKEKIKNHRDRKINGFFNSMKQFIITKNRKQCAKKFQLIFKSKNTQIHTTDDYLKSILFPNNSTIQSIQPFLDNCKTALEQRLNEEVDARNLMKKVTNKVTQLLQEVKDDKDDCSRSSCNESITLVSLPPSPQREQQIEYQEPALPSQKKQQVPENNQKSIIIVNQYNSSSILVSSNEDPFKLVRYTSEVYDYSQWDEINSFLSF